MGHNRLSIRDLSEKSNQPLYSVCGNYILLYNGEIYNCEELSDYFFNIGGKVTSDTVLLLQLLISEGKSIIPYLEGIFSFVFINIKTGEIVAARDTSGIKPLYLLQTDNVLIISSELKGIKYLHDKPIEISEDDLFESLALGFTTEPATGFKDIKKVPPGSYVCFSNFDEISRSKFIFKSIKNETTNFKKHLFDTMARQTLSDAKVGIFFLRDRFFCSGVLPNLPLFTLIMKTD